MCGRQEIVAAMMEVVAVVSQQEAASNKLAAK
jgi:hypothetical protein